MNSATMEGLHAGFAKDEASLELKVKGALSRLVVSQPSGKGQEDEPCEPTSIVLERPELLTEIFKSLSPADLARSVCCVSRQWRDIALYTESVWQDYIDPPLLRLVRGLRRAPNVPVAVVKPSHKHSTSHHSPTSSLTGLLGFGAGVNGSINGGPTLLSISPPAATTGPLWQLGGGAGGGGGVSSTSSSGPAGALGLSLPRVYLAVHGRNFLRNPTFSKLLNLAINPLGRKPWLIRDTGDGARFESPPVDVVRGVGSGAGEMPDTQLPSLPTPYPHTHHSLRLLRQVKRLLQPELPGCVATGKEWAELVQVVNLHEELQQRGLSASQSGAVLDSGLPLGLAINVASHHAHAAHFAVGLLLDDSNGPVPSMQSFVASRPGAHQWFSGKLHIGPHSGWRRFAYLLPQAPSGFRRAVVLLRGRQASGGSEGPLGAKLASAELMLLSGRQVEDWGENAASEEWKRRSGAAEGFDRV